MKKIVAIIGARPQFIKHAPLEIALKEEFEVISVHTGQHYDANMSQIFFDELKMSVPAYKLEVGSHSHGKQTALMLQEIERILKLESPDALMVYGDTNSTLAGALAAAKIHIPIIHVEAGLRSFNKKMPEEINRILTDHVSSLLFASTESAVQNLKNENITEGVYHVGDVMQDSVILAQKFASCDIDNDFILMTIHRPYNTDDKNRLHLILSKINALNKLIIFPIHPRTKNLMINFGLDESTYSNIKFIEPQAYFKNIGLLMKADCLITDSGGMQKEAYILQTKCITIRYETEWVETLENGWNTLVFDNFDRLGSILDHPQGNYINGIYGDGSSAYLMSKIISDKI